MVEPHQGQLDTRALELAKAADVRSEALERWANRHDAGCIEFREKVYVGQQRADADRRALKDDMSKGFSDLKDTISKKDNKVYLAIIGVLLAALGYFLAEDGLPGHKNPRNLSARGDVVDGLR